MYANSFFIIILSLITIVHNAAIAENPTCIAEVDKFSQCAADISAPFGCKSTVLNFTNTGFAQCQGVNFFYASGANNMTLIIETSFTQQRQPYYLSLANSPIMEIILHVYRIIDNQEIDITTRNATLVQKSDSNYQIILKFQGPPVSTRGGVHVIFTSYKA